VKPFKYWRIVAGQCQKTHEGYVVLEYMVHFPYRKVRFPERIAEFTYLSASLIPQVHAWLLRPLTHLEESISGSSKREYDVSGCDLLLTSLLAPDPDFHFSSQSPDQYHHSRPQDSLKIGVLVLSWLTTSVM
jgi:hypothetical protein